MDTDSKRRFFPYHRRLFLLLLGFSWTLTACFLLFQYNREKQFKIERLDDELQMVNLKLLNALDEEISPTQPRIDSKTLHALEDLRITILNRTGEVLFDSSLDTLPTTNHLSRPEVSAALSRGHGYTLRRHSESTGGSYFYSARADSRYIVRTAVPYALPLDEMLAADRGFLYFMLCATLLMSIAAYFATRRLGHTITRLNAFAKRAERGERIDDEAPFPHDELGEISNHIVRLYATLQRTAADRDRQHAAALHEEQEKIRIKRQLTNNINHELKTPVAVIHGYLETLRRNPGLDAARREEFIAKSCAQSERLGHLLQDVLTITRMDEGREQIRRERVVLNDLVAEVASEMELRPADQRLRLHVSLPEELAVEGSPSLLASIFRNLADNAAAYSGGRDIYIELLDTTPEYYTLRFADNGIGVDEEHLAHLFERFYRVDKGRSRKLGGTGLGLSIVRNAVALHGGEISARNGAEGGLEFRFTLRRGNISPY